MKFDTHVLDKFVSASEVEYCRTPIAVGQPFPLNYKGVPLGDGKIVAMDWTSYGQGGNSLMPTAEQVWRLTVEVADEDWDEMLRVCKSDA